MKKNLSDEAGDALVELEQFVYHAANYWQSYWSLDSREAHDRFHDVFSRHEWWYVGTREAYFLGAILSLAKYFESNARSINIVYFSGLLSDSDIFYDEAKEIFAIINECQSPSKDIAFIRNNYYAHKSRNLSFREMFQKTALRYDDIPDIIQKMADALNCVVSSIGGSQLYPEAIAERTAQEMDRLLQALDGRVRPDH